MTQRFNIQYSIDIEDLEEEVKRLLDKAQNELLAISKFNIENSLSLKSLEKIDKTRRGLASVDVALQDISAIVGGYVTYKATENMPQADSVEIEDHQKERPVSNEEPAPPEYSF
tara:strand:+ start:1960 stop:2301 length:342 start_codon:yes stop_codon:yes gene_type:complete